MWKFLFWFSISIIFFNYIGYALIIFLINKLKQKFYVKNKSQTLYFPSVSFIVAAYNEEECIEKKILNSFEQDYPAEKIEFIFITDGSSDETTRIISHYDKIRLLHLPERRGKSAALNRAVSLANNDILIFSDANTILNKDATRFIARHYANSSVGGVAGEKKVLSNTLNLKDVGESEGVYWKYESILKKLDSEFYSVVGAAGELFSVRKSLYSPVADNIILDDFIISLRVAGKGYRVIYEPDSYAMELPSFSLEDERKRKVRIAAGGFQSMLILLPLLKFWRHPRLTFLYISHRLLRWTLTPLCLIIAFISNFMVVLESTNYFYAFIFICQLIFYALANLGYLFPNVKNLKICKLIYYFVFMNISVFYGFIRFVKRKQPAAWEKAKRISSVQI